MAWFEFAAKRARDRVVSTSCQPLTLDTINELAIDSGRGVAESEGSRREAAGEECVRGLGDVWGIDMARLRTLRLD
jgi:hypothetical protein